MTEPMTNWQAAEKLLRDEGEPLHYREIYERAERGGLVQPSPDAKTPAQTLRAAMMKTSQDLFVQLGGGMYGLKEWGIDETSVIGSEISSTMLDREQQVYNTALLNKQVILFGPPGTSKTFYAKRVGARIAARRRGQIEEELLEDQNWISNHVKEVQFHPSYSYESFMEGIFPRVEEKTGKLSFTIKNGFFKQVCDHAKNRKNENIVIILDEINRADLSQVFGEIFSALEYRSHEIVLQYSQEPFTIPDNVHIIGTMNTLDKSTIDLDYALMRRFTFIEIPPSKLVLRKILEQNDAEEDAIDRTLHVFDSTQSYFNLGHAFFKNVRSIDDLRDLWDTQLSFLLKQYYGVLHEEDYRKIESIWWGKSEEE